MSHAETLKAVFFDIGNTLGTVSADSEGYKLTPFDTSSALLRCFRDTLGLKLGIITNIPPEMTGDMVRRLLATAGLLAFLDDGAIVTSRDAGTSKPDARIYLYAARRVGLPIGQCLYVGEDPQEVVGAHQAGMVGLLKPSLS